MYINVINRNLHPPDVAPATPAKHTALSRGEDDEVVSHLDRQAGQTVIDIVDQETKAVPLQVLPQDVLQLSEVVNDPKSGAIR
jgi:hypothetical protein